MSFTNENATCSLFQRTCYFFVVAKNPFLNETNSFNSDLLFSRGCFEQMPHDMMHDIFIYILKFFCTTSMWSSAVDN